MVTTGKIRLLDHQTSSEKTLDIIEPGEFWIDGFPGFIESGVVGRASDNLTALRFDEKLLQDVRSKNIEFDAAWKECVEQWSFFLTFRAAGIAASISRSQLREVARYIRRFHMEADSTQSLATHPGINVVEQGMLRVGHQGKVQEFCAGDYFVAGTVGPLHGIEGTVDVVEPVSLVSLPAAQLELLQTRTPEIYRHLCHDLRSKPASGSNHFGGGKHVESASRPAVDESLLVQFRDLLQNYPVVTSKDAGSSAMACLSMVALYLNKSIDLQEASAPGEQAAALDEVAHLVETAEEQGFMVRAIQASFDGLRNARLPLICLYGDQEFVVLYEIAAKDALIANPEVGLVRIARDEFDIHYRELAIELVPVVSLQMPPNSKNPLTLILPLLKPWGKELRDIVLASLICQAIATMAPFFTQTIVDHVIVHEDISMLNMLLIGMLLVTVFQMAVNFGRGVLISALSSKIDHALFGQFFRHLFSLPIAYFEQKSIADLFARFNENSKITAFLSSSAITTLLDGPGSLFYICILFVNYNVSFGFATLAYLAILIIATRLYTPLLRGYTQQLFNKEILVDSAVIESVKGVERIKASAAEPRFHARWESHFLEYMAISFRHEFAMSGYSTVTQLAHLVGRILILFMGAHLVIQKQFTVGQYMAATMMASMVVGPAMRLFQQWSSVQSISIAAGRLNDVFKEKPEELSGKTRLRSIQGRIEFRNVSFRYPNASRYALRNISFTLMPGQMVAIVGRSGCGKSTLSKLMQGLHTPSAGTILVDGVDLSRLNLRDYRRRIGSVSQTDFFFADLVKENLSLCAPDATLETIVEAARKAGIHERIEHMGSGYDTMLSEEGKNLSGGERQRLSIARALVHNPRILIFDEATSALDYESERQVQASINELRKDRSVLVIAHRLSTIRTADIILVMDDGEIVQRGPHAELLAVDGPYKVLCSQQAVGGG